MLACNCLEALFPETRRLLLQVLLATADKQWYLAELAAALEKSSSSLQRELDSLVGVGLLNRQTVGRKVYFQANPGSPYFRVLQQVFAVQAATERAA
jgi:DNA-binding IclR family transcriptional regulator